MTDGSLEATLEPQDTPGLCSAEVIARLLTGRYVRREG